jgi:hypothetical protein
MNDIPYKFEKLEQTILAEIDKDGIDAVQDKYLAQSVDIHTRQMARAIFGNLEQDQFGKWSFGKS